MGGSLATMVYDRLTYNFYIWENEEAYEIY